MGKQINNTKLKLEKIFNLLVKYPIYIDLIKHFRSWNGFFEFMENNYKDGINEIPSDVEIERIFNGFIELLIEAEEEITEIENTKEYEYPVFAFDFDVIKKYMERSLIGTGNKILYLNYILKEYPNHVVLRMNVFHRIFNDFLLESENWDKYIKGLKILKSLKSNKDILFPEPPLRFEDKIINELKYLNLRHGLEESGSPVDIQEQNQLEKLMTELKNSLEKLGKKDEIDLMTISEAMKYLKISRSSIYRFVRSGIFHYTIIGHKKYISREAIERAKTKITGKRER